MSVKYSSKTVHINNSKGLEKTTFGDCIFDLLEVEPSKEVKPHAPYTKVVVEENDQKITLQKVKEKGIFLGHAPDCPCTKSYDRQKLKKKEIFTAVCVVIENIDTQEVLITQRAKFMRTFPNTWVFPGGHVDEGEHFEEAALRELSEETGIRITSDQIELFSLWESVYPPFIEIGEPQKQHLIAFYKAKVTSDQMKIQNFYLEKTEVQASAWISKEIALKALDQEKHCKEKFKCFVNENEKLLEKEIEISNLQFECLE
eukprot:gene2049-1555_t